MDNIDKSLAERLKLERESRGWSLSVLAERSGVSRTMINNVERGIASPTAALLGRLSGAFGLTLSTLLARAEAGQRERLMRAADQPLWKDPRTGYTRRQVAPGTGSDLPFEVIDIDLPAGAEVAYPAAAYAFIRQAVWVLRGELVIEEGPALYRLAEGDSLEAGAPVDRTYRNESDKPCRYAVVVLKC